MNYKGYRIEWSHKGAYVEVYLNDEWQFNEDNFMKAKEEIDRLEESNGKY